MTPEIKASFHSFDDAGLNAFYKENQLMLILTELIKTFSILQKNGIFLGG